MKKFVTILSIAMVSMSAATSAVAGDDGPVFLPAPPKGAPGDGPVIIADPVSETFCRHFENCTKKDDDTGPDADRKTPSENEPNQSGETSDKKPS